jgi:hypothetical protein
VAPSACGPRAVVMQQHSAATVRAVAAEAADLKAIARM